MLLLSFPLILALVVGMVTGLVLALITFMVWPQLFQHQPYLYPVWYLLGTVPLLVGYTVWAGLTGYGETAVALWIIVGIAGAICWATYGFHWLRDEPHGAAEGADADVR